MARITGPNFFNRSFNFSCSLEPILSPKHGAFLALNTGMNDKAYKLCDQKYNSCFVSHQ